MLVNANSNGAFTSGAAATVRTSAARTTAAEARDRLRFARIGDGRRVGAHRRFQPGRQALRLGKLLSRLFVLAELIEGQGELIVRLRIVRGEPDRFAELGDCAGDVVLFQLLAADADGERRRLRVR